MLGMEEWMEVKELKRQGIRSRIFVGRRATLGTEARKILRGAGPIRRMRKKHGSKLDEYKAYLESRYEKTGLSAVRLTEEIRGMGFTGSVECGEILQ